MKQFVIKYQNHNGFDMFMESHCAAVVWKNNIDNAKKFKTKREAQQTLKRWKISYAEIVPVS